MVPEKIVLQKTVKLVWTLTYAGTIVTYTYFELVSESEFCYILFYGVTLES